VEFVVTAGLDGAFAGSVWEVVAGLVQFASPDALEAGLPGGTVEAA
jgi:hypothetical protein